MSAALRSVDLPPIRPIVTRVELSGGRGRCCGRRYKAQAPLGMAPGSPFGPGIRALMAHLHQSHHVGCERFSRIAGELLGLTISEGAIANMFRRLRTSMDAATTAIRAKLLKARIIASDETTTRTNGVIQLQWVFLSSNAVLHKIASRRARSVAKDVLGQHRPDVRVSDRYSGRRELGREHQVASRMCFAMFRTPSTAATLPLLRTSATICAGPLRLGDDEISSRTAPWRNTPPKPTIPSIVWSPGPSLIPQGAFCSSKSGVAGEVLRLPHKP